MGRMSKKIGKKKQFKKQDHGWLRSIFWRVFPFALFVVVMGYFFLLSDGYQFFEKRGWNPTIILVIRYLDHFVLALVGLAFCVFLSKVYINVWKGWRKGVYVSLFNEKIVEIVLLSIVFLVPIGLILYLIIDMIMWIFTAPNDYWKMRWELK